MPRQSTKTASFLISLLILISQGCGGGGSAGSKATVSGTAAFGAPAANATITVKGTNGVSKTTATGADGKYSLDVTGLSAPFLLRVDLATGSALYSVGGQAGVINIHPFTDLIIQTWYKVQNKTIVAAFNDPANNPPPSATEVKVIAVVAKEITQKWLADNGIDPTTFDLISTPFDANSTGFDKVLDLTTVDANGVITISDGTTTQTTTVTADTTDGSATISTTTSSGGTTSSSVSSVIVPTSSAQQTALNGAGASLNQLATTVNSKGAALADTDLIGLLDAGYRNDGFGANIGAARLASELRGAKLNSVQVDRILSYDDTNKIISIAGTVSMTVDGVALTEKLTPDDGFSFRQQTDGKWLLYGNQRPASGGLQVEMRTDVFPPCPSSTTCGTIGPRKSINVDVRALKDTISTVAISGGGIFNNTSVPKSTTTDVETVDATPTSSLTIEKDAFFAQVDLAEFPAAGTVFTITVTPVSGSPVSFTVTTTGTTTEPISITSPTGHTLADATLGQPLTVNWTLPKTFPVDSVGFGGHVSTAGNAFQCQVDVTVASTATSGQITFPSTCNGEPATEATINVSTNGPNGERNMIIYNFGG